MTLVLGSSGSVGSYICKRLEEDQLGPIFHGTRDVDGLPGGLHTVIWCQGYNVNDTLGALDFAEYSNCMSINVDFIVKTLDHLLKTDKLVHPCRLCVISSIFQEYSRNNKFSYSVSKSALGGLIRSAAVDLFSKGSLINGILPGPIDNAMTRKTLTLEQIKRLEPYMVSLESVYSLCKLLCFNNSSITGQSILVDNGLSISRNW